MNEGKILCVARVKHPAWRYLKEATTDSIYYYSLSVGQYGPRDRLLLCRGASGSGHSHKVLDGCLEHINASISCLFAGRMSSERRRERITPPGRR